MEYKPNPNKVPKWFDGVIYEDGGHVTNPFTGAGVDLTNVELSVYDFIKGAEAVLNHTALPASEAKKLTRTFRRALSWFGNANSEAYMVLLD